MDLSNPSQTQPLDAHLWQAVCQVVDELAQESDLTRTLEGIVECVQHYLQVDRVGIFYYDREDARLVRLIGVTPRGQIEYEPPAPLPMNPEMGGPLRQVARGEIPYFHSHDVRVDVPDVRYDEEVRAQAVVPLVAGGRIIGAMAVDNLLTGRDLPESLLQPLCLFGHFTAVALYNALRQRELYRAELQKKEFYREVVFAITNGKLVLCDHDEIETGWAGAEERVEIGSEADIRSVREMIDRAAGRVGMNEERAYELGLCGSEAATNALRHGEGGWAEVAQLEGRLRVRIDDRGRGIDPASLPRATLMKGFSTRASMGLGFTIMHELADKIYLHTGNEGTSLVLEMNVAPPALVDLPVALLNWDD